MEVVDCPAQLISYFGFPISRQPTKGIATDLLPLGHLITGSVKREDLQNPSHRIVGLNFSSAARVVWWVYPT